MKTLLSLAALLAAGPALAEQIDAPALSHLPRADVVVLGERHDNPAHHANQARAVAALAPSALVFEMLTPEQAAKVTPALRADRAALEKALGWADTGWPDFAMYHPIFTASDAAIYGAALPRDEVRRAVGEGAAEVFGEQAAAYGLADALPGDQQQEREDLQREAHCNALPETLLAGMVEAQRLRDAAFARTVAQAVAETGGPVAVQLVDVASGEATELVAFAQLCLCIPSPNGQNIVIQYFTDMDQPLEQTLLTINSDGEVLDRFDRTLEDK